MGTISILTIILKRFYPWTNYSIYGFNVNELCQWTKPFVDLISFNGNIIYM